MVSIDRSGALHSQPEAAVPHSAGIRPRQSLRADAEAESVSASAPRESDAGEFNPSGKKSREHNDDGIDGD